MTLGFLIFCGAVGWVAWYRVSLVQHPFTPCQKCNGSGKNPGSTRTKYGQCRKCGGSGRKERFGRRLFGIDRDR